jgi:hypothetical protein
MMLSNNHHSSSFLVIFLTACLILPITNAQVGTITQDLTTLSAFPLQKACAQSCFLTTGFCPNDVLGSQIGCAVHTDCYDNNWLAKNDCYCRQDLQVAAQSILTSCISRECKAGDDAIDASSAGSIYAQYCKEKGYPNPTAPAVVQATTTKSGGLTVSTAGGANSQPTTSTTQEANSSSSKLSTTTIIGISVGGAIGLGLLLYGLWKCLARRPPPPQYQTQPQYQYQHAQPQFTQQPFYPQNPYPEPYYPKPHAESEVSPDDSVSMVGGPARPAPTLVSAAQGYPRGY